MPKGSITILLPDNHEIEALSRLSPGKKVFYQRTCPHFFYGWVIVGLAFCSLAFWFGIRTSFSVFYVTLGAEFPWQPGALAGAQSTAMIAAMVSAPMLGALIDRFGPRKVILPGVLITAIGLALCATMTTLFEFYLYYGIIAGSAVTAVGVVAYSVVLRNWFQKKRGFASGIAVSGMGIGMLCFVPLVQYSIISWGWRNAYLLLSVFGLLCLFPATFVLLRLKPVSKEGQPNAERVGVITTEPAIDRPAFRASLSNISLYETVTQRAFWHFMLFSFFASIGVYIILVHSVKFLVDQGTDVMLAAMVLAVVGAISSVFRILWGWLSDRVGRELAYTLGSMIACLGIVCLLLRDMSGMAGFTYLFALLFGIGWGATAPSVMASSADIFDGRRYGFIFGLVQGVINMAGAIGAWIGGAIFGRYQSYDIAFVLAVIALGLSCLFIWMAAPRKKFAVAWKTGL